MDHGGDVVEHASAEAASVYGFAPRQWSTLSSRG